MQIRTVLSGAIAFGLLASTSAQALMTLPSTTTGSSMFVTVFDSVTFESFTTDLGLFYNSFINNTVAPGTILPGAYTPRAFNLNMGIFADNNAANIRFNVYAGDSFGTTTQRGFLLTSNGLPTATNAQITSINNLGVAEIVKFNGNCPASEALTGCAGASGADNIWGSTINGSWGAGSAASFNQEISFFSVTGASLPSSTPGTVTPFTNGGLAWNWMLTETGTLTWSAEPAPIPLPAAVWLLISGLAGLGAIGRRSSQKA